MSDAIDVQFVELRRSLHRAHYTQPLGIESVSLVSRLFEDVNVLKQSLQQHQQNESDVQQQLSNAQTKLVPLRRENGRLVESNNVLHRQLLQQADAMDRLERDANNNVEQARAEAANFK